MMNIQTSVIMGLDNEVIQVVAFDQLYFMTRADFLRLEKQSRMIEAVIRSGQGLSTIRHIFDESLSDLEVETRFNEWKLSCPDEDPPPEMKADQF
jgi:hypothetical protein